MREALAHAIHDDNELKHTVDISRQWQELVVGPIDEASKAITAPVLIIIDALHESGDPKSREQIFRLLAGDPDTAFPRLSQLPAHFRIIITSRPLEDIGDALQTASHVLRISMKSRSTLHNMTEHHRDQNDATGLAQVITPSRSFRSSTAKAKTAKFIRTLLNYFNSISTSQQTQIDIPTDTIEWSTRAGAYSLSTAWKFVLFPSLQYKLALARIDALLTEFKRLNDRMVLTEVHLLESRVHRSIRNLSKAKAALTSPRTAANSIYCPPHLQAALDLQSGVLHAEDKGYTTAYSYFYEAFENMSSQDDPAALNALKYTLLCKVMLNMPEDVTSLLSIKLAVKYAQLHEIGSMRAIALAHQNRNLAYFEKAGLQPHRTLVGPHHSLACCSVLPHPSPAEHLRIVEPYSVVEIGYVAKQVG